MSTAVRVEHAPFRVVHRLAAVRDGALPDLGGADELVAGVAHDLFPTAPQHPAGGRVHVQYRVGFGVHHEDPHRQRLEDGLEACLDLDACRDVRVGEHHPLHLAGRAGHRGRREVEVTVAEREVAVLHGHAGSHDDPEELFIGLRQRRVLDGAGRRLQRAEEVVLAAAVEAQHPGIAVDHDDGRPGRLDDGPGLVVGEADLFVGLAQVQEYLAERLRDDADRVERDQGVVVERLGLQWEGAHDLQQLVDLVSQVRDDGRVALGRGWHLRTHGGQPRIRASDGMLRSRVAHGQLRSGAQRSSGPRRVSAVTSIR